MPLFILIENNVLSMFFFFIGHNMNKLNMEGLIPPKITINELVIISWYLKKLYPRKIANTK